MKSIVTKEDEKSQPVNSVGKITTPEKLNLMRLTEHSTRIGFQMT